MFCKLIGYFLEYIGSWAFHIAYVFKLYDSIFQTLRSIVEYIHLLFLVLHFIKQWCQQVMNHLPHLDLYGEQVQLNRIRYIYTV